MGFWVSFGVLAGVQGLSGGVIGVFLLRMICLTWIFQASRRHLDPGIQWFFIPVFDLLFVIYYITVGFTAFFAKQTRWN
jgi:cell division protein FtsX